MRASRLAAAALVAGGALLAIAPAALAGTPTGAWTDPAPHGTVDEVPVAYLERHGPLVGYAQFEGGIAGVTFTLVTDAAEPGEPCSAAESVPPQAAQGGTTRVDFAFEALFPCNRRYQVRATVAPQQRPFEDDQPLVLNLWVDVAIPPPVVPGVAAEVVGRTVVVRWDPVEQSPDFEGYQILRAADDGDVEPIAEATPEERSYVDDRLPEEGGTFRYRVRAMRPGPKAGTTVFGEAGESEPAEVPDSATDDDVDEADEDADGGTEPGITGGSGRGGGTTVRQTSRPPAPRRLRTVTTLDTGFEEALPFRPRPAEPGGDPAVVARLDDGGDDTGQRDTLLLIAGGTTAFSWAMLLRFISRKALVF